jgi:acyl-CoA dehydrogenase
MAWDFCAEPNFQPALGWIEKLVADQLRPLETRLAYLGHEDAQRALAPLEQQMRGQGPWTDDSSEGLGSKRFGLLGLAQMNLITGRVGVEVDVCGNMSPAHPAVTLQLSARLLQAGA